MGASLPAWRTKLSSLRNLWIFREPLRLCLARDHGIKTNSYRDHKFNSLPTRQPPPSLSLALTCSALDTLPFTSSDFSQHAVLTVPPPLHNLSSTWNVHPVRAALPADLSNNITSPWAFTDLLSEISSPSTCSQRLGYL